MSECCKQVGIESALAGSVCQEVERRFGKPCREMDSSLPYVDYSASQWQTAYTQPDQNTDISEVIWWAFKFATDEYLQNFQAGRPIGAKDSFVAFLGQKKLAPPWMIRSESILNDVRTILKKDASQKERLRKLSEYLKGKVYYSPIPDMKILDADATFSAGNASCLEWSTALYGLLLLGGIPASLAENDYPGPFFFHVGIVAMPEDGEKTYIDPSGIIGEVPPNFTEATELSTIAFFITERVITREMPGEWLYLADQIVPNDIHVRNQMRQKQFQDEVNYGKLGKNIRAILRQHGLDLSQVENKREH